jgi:hypothetical protein
VGGPASVAQQLCRETEGSRELRLKLAAERKAMPHSEALREGSRRNAIAVKSTGFEAESNGQTGMVERAVSRLPSGRAILHKVSKQPVETTNCLVRLETGYNKNVWQSCPTLLPD